MDSRDGDAAWDLTPKKKLPSKMLIIMLVVLGIGIVIVYELITTFDSPLNIKNDVKESCSGEIIGVGGPQYVYGAGQSQVCYFSPGNLHLNLSSGYVWLHVNVERGYNDNWYHAKDGWTQNLDYSRVTIEPGDMITNSTFTLWRD